MHAPFHTWFQHWKFYWAWVGNWHGQSGLNGWIFPLLPRQSWSWWIVNVPRAVAIITVPVLYLVLCKLLNCETINSCFLQNLINLLWSVVTGVQGNGKFYQSSCAFHQEWYQLPARRVLLACAGVEGNGRPIKPFAVPPGTMSIASPRWFTGITGDSSKITDGMVLPLTGV